MTESERRLREAIDHLVQAAELLSAVGYFNRARDILDTVHDLSVLAAEEPKDIHTPQG